MSSVGGTRCTSRYVRCWWWGSDVSPWSRMKPCSRAALRKNHQDFYKYLWLCQWWIPSLTSVWCLWRSLVITALRTETQRLGHKLHVSWHAFLPEGCNWFSFLHGTGKEVLFTAGCPSLPLVENQTSWNFALPSSRGLHLLVALVCSLLQPATRQSLPRRGHPPLDESAVDFCDSVSYKHFQT